MTSLAEEQTEQRRWTSRLLRPTPIYDVLVENEFQSPDVQVARVHKALAMMLDFATREVPHYRRTVGTDIGGDPMEALATFPVLSKLDVQDAGVTLQPERLPDGVKAANWTASSGTTGRPTRVLHSTASARMFALLKQREYRWFRLDPAATFGSMRLPGHLPRHPDGREIASGETIRRATWPYLENFTTGPFVGVSLITPVEDRIAWLRTERPAYLMSLAESLEMLAMAAAPERPSEHLKGLIAISEQLTPGMRRYVKERFGVPVHQNYGLNEIGIVAARCEEDRYHVHAEHCVVEIVDDTGRACVPGETGRIVVTTLTNPAMPLIRYDTGDLAEAAAGTCACGRTLPSFGDIVGRYGRVAFLPPDSARLTNSLRETIETMPVELANGLREFQIHQYRDRRVELRLVVRTGLPDAFYSRVRDAWGQSAGLDGPSLDIVSVDAIARASGGKAEVFTSDFFPARDEMN